MTSAIPPEYWWMAGLFALDAALIALVWWTFRGGPEGPED